MTNVYMKTVRRAVEAPLPAPSAFMNTADWNLALPISETLPALDSRGRPVVGGPYAGGELKYSNATAADQAQSEAAEILPTVGNYTNPDWFYVARALSDNQPELVFRASIWGSPSTPFSGSDHTRSELRAIKAGPTNSGSSRGDFKLADQLEMIGLCRPLRFPDRDGNGNVTSTGNNLTMMQLHPVDSLDNAASSVFSIMALRANGRLQATMTNADGTNAAPTDPERNLLTGVQLGDLIWYKLVTFEDRLEWLVENRTQAPGTIRSLIQPIPDVLSNGVSQRTRFHYAKAGCYHATPVLNSTDASKVVNGVLPINQVADFAAVAYRQLSIRYLTAP